MANIGSGLMEISLDELRRWPSITKKKKTTITKKKKNKLTRRRTGKGTKSTGTNGLGLGTEDGRSIIRE